MNPQTTLFEDKTERTAKDLTITKQNKEILSKQQQSFNKLVKKIEKLRIELQQTNDILNSKLEFYGKFIYPLEQELTTLKKEVVKKLFTFYNNRKLFSKNRKEALKEVISAQLSTIFSSETGEPEIELQEIFKSIEGITYKEAVEEDFNTMKYEMAEMFDEFGFEMDLDDMNSNMSQEEIIKKMVEMQEQLKQQAEAKQQKSSSRKKTKKQLEKEEKEKLLEEARTKNISSIYRHLAKAFHPDLEQDEELKLEKEQLMKQLTIAYDKNDLHTLLSLEIAWIKKEENNPDKLGDDKLKIYNEVLKEQVQELEYEIQMLLEHPRYQPLQKFTMFFPEIKEINMGYKKLEIKEGIKDITESLSRLNGSEKAALAEVKNLIEIQQLHSKFNDTFDSLFR